MDQINLTCCLVTACVLVVSDVCFKEILGRSVMIIYFLSCACGMWKFPGQKLNQHHSSDSTRPLSTRPPGNSQIHCFLTCLCFYTIQFFYYGSFFLLTIYLIILNPRTIYASLWILIFPSCFLTL